jgi:hypothetical protein
MIAAIAPPLLLPASNDHTSFRAAWISDVAAQRRLAQM